MPHHFATGRSRATRESVPYYIAREVFIWNVVGHPDDHSFPGSLEAGDMALAVSGAIYIYTGRNWQILVSSFPEDSEEREIRNLTVEHPAQRLRVDYEDET